MLSKRTFLSVLLSIALVMPSLAPAQEITDPLEPGHTPRKQMATIVILGLAGGILGLSTLSFYGRPQDYLSNIAIGFALGVTAGTIYVTYRAARDPYDRRFQGYLEPRSSPSTRSDWADLYVQGAMLTPLQWTWYF